MPFAARVVLCHKCNRWVRMNPSGAISGGVTNKVLDRKTAMIQAAEGSEPPIAGVCVTGRVMMFG